MIYSDANPFPAEHTWDCVDWCNHCALCGDAILYGARCNAHLGVYPAIIQEGKNLTEEEPW